MDLHSYPQAEHGKFEQILNQFLLKSLHIILDSRVPANRPSSRGGEIKKTDKWFNLVLGDRPSAMESLSFWNRTLMEPMIIDIILVQESPNPSSEIASPAASGNEASTETVVERWMVQYEGQRLMAPQIGEATYKKMYRKSIILLRSVHAMLRLLPAYKAFRKLCSLKQNCDFVINYKVCSFSSPFSRAEEESMKKYSFVPIDIQPGRLSVSVIYREDLSDFNLDVLVSCPPHIITDYVGSPLTEPMRAFPSTPSEKSRPTSVPIRAKQSNSSSHFSDHTAGPVVSIRMFLHHRANPLVDLHLYIVPHMSIHLHLLRHTSIGIKTKGSQLIRRRRLMIYFPLRSHLLLLHLPLHTFLVEILCRVVCVRKLLQ
ncbi:UNVERIFIED_CONTAM: Autophagy-related protein 13a [Sesamum latifolium]|uniref:Autophagy-related protein 13a n=1 Tax=Sesamum latifolium TaxID=2727402 RepID=A0AAW2T7I0_9LAMI